MASGIRSATPDDAAAIAAIYAPYVERTAVSFEVVAPSAGEMRRRIEATLTEHPWLVEEEEGEIVGYAYLGAFKARPAYAHSAETSIYVREDARGRGIGRRLYAALESAAVSVGVRNLYASIAFAEAADPYLTRQSMDFHLRCGYRLVGVFRQCGRKFGRFYDMAYMEKILGRQADGHGP